MSCFKENELQQVKMRPSNFSQYKIKSFASGVKGSMP
jgi:hypothetical protein